MLSLLTAGTLGKLASESAVRRLSARRKLSAILASSRAFKLSALACSARRLSRICCWRRASSESFCSSSACCLTLLSWHCTTKRQMSKRNIKTKMTRLRFPFFFFVSLPCAFCAFCVDFFSLFAINYTLFSTASFSPST